jgi:hypothetical protein
MLYCEKCNHRYFGVSSISNHKTGERKIWYRCGGQQAHYVRCGAQAIKGEDIERVILAAMQDMLNSDKLKDNRWMCMTDGPTDTIPEISFSDLPGLKDELKSNQDKQLKLADLYLNNLLSEDTFKQKNEALRIEEEDLRTKLAGIELFLLEKENSAAYLDKVKEFLASYDSEKKEIDVAAQKQILGLLFKKFIIKKSGKSAVADCRIAHFWNAPFDKIILEEEKSNKWRRNNKIAAAISLKLTVDAWATIYHNLKRALEKIYKNAF